MNIYGIQKKAFTVTFDLRNFQEVTVNARKSNCWNWKLHARVFQYQTIYCCHLQYRSDKVFHDPMMCGDLSKSHSNIELSISYLHAKWDCEKEKWLKLWYNMDTNNLTNIGTFCGFKLCEWPSGFVLIQKHSILKESQNIIERISL